MTSPSPAPASLAESLKSRYRTGRAWFLSRGLGGRETYRLSAEEVNASSLVSVVVAVHDSPEVTARCLDSLKLFGGKAEIVVVDDASKLESTRSLLDKVCAQNQWKLIRNALPSGHSRASEAGVAVSTRPIICLLNSDTVVTHRSWFGVERAFAESPNIAVVGPSTSHTVGPQTVRRAHYCRHHWSDDQVFAFADHYVRRHDQKPLVDLPFVGGFAFFIRRTVWDQFGGFDKNLPDYGNETDLCQRILAGGLSIAWTQASYIHHLGSQSYGRTLGQKEIWARCGAAQVYMRGKLSSC